MKIFKRFGCGCVGILLEDNTQIIIEDCGNLEGEINFTHPISRVRPENLPGEFLTVSEHARLIERMNRQMLNGRKFEEVQRLLERK